MIDARSAANIATLVQDVQAKATAFLNAITESKRLPDGWCAKIISGNRSYADQAALYAQGRTKPGPIVTHAPPGYSNHNFGRAFDLGIFDAQDRYIDDLVPSMLTQSKVDYYYSAVAPIGKALGLFWGGDWDDPDTDTPHYELRPDWAAQMNESEMMAEMRRRLTEDESLV